LVDLGLELTTLFEIEISQNRPCNKMQVGNACSV